MSKAGSDSVSAALRCEELYLGSAPTLENSSAVPSADEFLRPDCLIDAPLAALLSAVDVVLVECGALEAAAFLQQSGVEPALVYIDPPYASHRDYLFAQKHPEDGSRVERVAFSDRWDGGMDAYVDSLAPVFEATHRVLDAEGSFLLHVDPRGAPYLSIRCDRIFGMGERLAAKNAPGFRNELIWSYGLGGSSPRSWPKKHDNILWYTKGSDWFFEPPMTPAKSNRMKGLLKKQPDVIDVATINNMAKDRTGYPTQKPIELLEMFVQAHAQSGALVADFFSGSGTTALAAFRRGRKAFASDISPDAIAVARDRLVEQGARVAILRPIETSNVGETTTESVTDGTRITRLETDAILEETAIVFSAEGRLFQHCFVVEADAEPTHRLRRDVYGIERIQPLESP